MYLFCKTVFLIYANDLAVMQAQRNIRRYVCILKYFTISWISHDIEDEWVKMCELFWKWVANLQFLPRPAFCFSHFNPNLYPAVVLKQHDLIRHQHICQAKWFLAHYFPFLYGWCTTLFSLQIHYMFQQTWDYSKGRFFFLGNVIWIFKSIGIINVYVSQRIFNMQSFYYATLTFSMFILLSILS